LLSIRDAALATGLTPKALRRRIERGTLQSVMVDGRRRIAMEELLERGLLVPLDADGRPRLARPVQRPAAAANALTERLRMLERRVSALEEQLRRPGA
jgi:DNA-binding transcriptional MerR regulator